jgi:hypothetical protein
MATEIVTKELSPVFYILVLIAIAMVVSIIVLMRKMNYKEIFKSICISLLISIVIEFILYIVSFFLTQPVCKMDGVCPSSADIIVSESIYFVPSFLLIVLFIYLIIRKIKS